MIYVYSCHDGQLIIDVFEIYMFSCLWFQNLDFFTFILVISLSGEFYVYMSIAIYFHNNIQGK